MLGFGAAATLSALNASNYSLGGAASLGSDTEGRGEAVVDPEDSRQIDRVLADLVEKRVIFVAESHDRYDHHLNQLAIIRGLHERGVDLAVGVEFFQEPFQPHLDRFIAGEIGEKAMLKQTEYYERWGYDYRLYRDILEYGRDHRIPLIALNAPAELVGRVSANGIDALGSDDRALLPADLPSPDTAYQDRLRPVFEMHGRTSEERFRRFVDVQMLWDEHMARVARDYLNANPEKTLVILAGSGHVAFADAIPGRLARMVSAGQAVVATGRADRFSDGDLDYLLVERDVELAPSGSMGMMLASEDSAVKIRAVHPASPAAGAGFRPGDQILSIAGEPIRGVDDVKLALLDRAPGDEVWVEVDPGEAAQAHERRARVLTLL
jgi:uncharacterized iron-regulated protein